MNLAELAGQVGKMLEHPNQSQPNPGVGEQQCHPVFIEYSHSPKDIRDSQKLATPIFTKGFFYLLSFSALSWSSSPSMAPWSPICSHLQNQRAFAFSEGQVFSQRFRSLMACEEKYRVTVVSTLAGLTKIWHVPPPCLGSRQLQYRDEI